MEDTCKGKDCWLYLLAKEMIGNKGDALSEFKNCPFYVEMMWTPNPVGGKIESAKIIKDCSNKRSLLVLLEDIHPRLTGVQKSHEEMRNSTAKATEIFTNILTKVAMQPRIESLNENVITITDNKHEE